MCYPRRRVGCPQFACSDWSNPRFTFSFDIDLPVECDDEYWEQPDPVLAFKQPENKPSTISFFVSYLKLFHIQAFALRTLVRPFSAEPLANLT